MNLLDIYHSTLLAVSPFDVTEVLAANHLSQKFGLLLTAAQAQELVDTRNRSVRDYGRVEIGTEALKLIIAAFCSSPYINANEYAVILNELVDIFYCMKNETGDRIGDEKLIHIMKEFFNCSCRGSLELLKNRELVAFVKIFRLTNPRS